MHKVDLVYFTVTMVSKVFFFFRYGVFNLQTPDLTVQNHARDPWMKTETVLDVKLIILGLEMNETKNDFVKKKDTLWPIHVIIDYQDFRRSDKRIA